MDELTGLLALVVLHSGGITALLLMVVAGRKRRPPQQFTVFYMLAVLSLFMQFFLLEWIRDIHSAFYVNSHEGPRGENLALLGRPHPLVPPAPFLSPKKEVNGRERFHPAGNG